MHELKFREIPLILSEKDDEEEEKKSKKNEF